MMLSSIQYFLSLPEYFPCQLFAFNPSLLSHSFSTFSSLLFSSLLFSSLLFPFLSSSHCLSLLCFSLSVAFSLCFSLEHQHIIGATVELYRNGSFMFVGAFLLELRQLDRRVIAVQGIHS